MVMKTMLQIQNLGFILMMFVAVSCTNSQGENRSDTEQPAGEYEVIELEPQSATLYKDYPTALEGQQTVEIRPKIAGYIDEILVDEGAYVKKGQVLFRLFANDIQASVRSAEAQVKVADAEVASAKINLEKTRPLVDKDIISKFELESVEAILKSKEAQLVQAQAMLANAKANLQYTVITSPTDGIISNFPFRVGSLVSSSISQPLTTVSNTSDMYAYFAMNEKEFLALTKDLKGNTVHEKLNALPEVSLVLPDNSLYDQPGRIETASGLIDAQTGAVNIRATFPNTEGILRSGGSGLVRIPQHIHSSIVIPQKATYELQGKHFVYTVGNDNRVKSTEIEVLAGNLKDSYVVTSGLKTGDRVVVEGIASLNNDQLIKPRISEPDKPSESIISETLTNN